MKPQEVIPHLPNWSKDDLLMVRTIINSLIGNGDDPPGPLYDVLCTACGNNIPFSSFSKSRYYKHWLINEQIVLKFIDHYWPTAGKVTLNSLEHFLFNMLVEDLKKRRIVATIGIIAVNASSIPALFERNFPGYLEAGLAPVVITRMIDGKST